MRSSSAAETERAAAQLAERLRPGDLVLVRGEMGAGKTTFVRGAARALGVTGPVTSPTFTIGQLYESPRGPIAHLDLHRLDSLEDEDPALLADYLTPGAIAFVEWPEVGGGELAARATHEVTLRHVGLEERDVEISA
ncbi:MAG: tRNA (adenosine(37)-N6)-threonylcarbamoyltransferase complex ATPase subunit type 1 TsaE [Solirubrobacteraceae bacterium]